MKLAVWQTFSLPGDAAGNIAALAVRAASAAAAGAEVLVCPELWLSGYNQPDLIPGVAEPRGGASFQAISRLAAAHHIAIAYGYPEAEDDHLYNSVQLIDAAGRPLGHYRKTHLFGGMERQLFTPGDRLESPVRLGDWSVGLLICYDVEFPEAVRHHALAGADLLLVPTALGIEGIATATTLVPARALENHLHIAYANHCGVEAGLTYAGSSCISGPEGLLIAAASNETLLMADLEKAAQTRARAAAPYLNDRRPDLYRI